MAYYEYGTVAVTPFLRKFYKQVIIAVVMLYVATMALTTLTTHAALPPNWTVMPGAQLDFSCSSLNYVHTLDTVTPGSGGAFTGTGHYNTEPSYTWNMTGNISGDVLTFSILYTGTASGSVYNGTNGLIAPNGSVSGVADSNCQSFTMPAGSFMQRSTSEIDVYGNTGVENQKGAWMFNRDVTTATPYAFNTAQHVIGNGALYVLPIQNNSVYGNQDKFIAEYFAREAISNFDSFSYDFKIAGPAGDASDANQYYANFYTTLADGTTYYNCRFNFVPTIGSTSSFMTFTIDKNTVADTVGGTACPTTLGNMPAGSYIRAIAINVGDISASDTDLAGYFDNVKFNTYTNSKIYDFEADVTAPKKPKHISPADGSTIHAHDFTFTWTTVTDPSSPVTYEWEASYSKDTAGNGGAFVTQLAYHSGLSGGSVYSPGTPDGKYYWHVRSVDAAGNKSAWTNPWKVTVNTMPRDKDECKKDGWKHFGMFRNQGDCVSHVHGDDDDGHDGDHDHWNY